MGFCIDGDDQFDVFLSYASADDKFHNGWVSDFEQCLKDQVRAELIRKGAKEKNADQLSVCRDKTGFPQGGDLKEVINARIRQSQFLFIFLGEGYLESEWCLWELEILREKVGGTVSVALESLYLIVLDQQALDKLRDGNEPRQLTQKRKRLWIELQRLTTQAIRIETFLRSDGKLMPVLSTPDRVDRDFHEQCTKIVEELAKKIITRREGLQIPLRQPVDNPKCFIAIGPVPKRLMPARSGLVKALGGSQVCLIEEVDLTQPDKVRKTLRNVNLFIQPFDRFEPIFVRGVGDPHGGHLALLKQLFEDEHGGVSSVSDASMIWWKPHVSAPSDASEISDYDRIFIDEIDGLPGDQKRNCSVLELSKEILAFGKKSSATARVWIEWEESDQEIIEEAKNIVRKCFDEHCKAQKALGIHVGVSLDFGIADWEKLEMELKEKPDGIVIVYNNNKDYNALRSQEQAISDMEEVLMKKIFPGIFYIRQKGMYQPSEHWRVVRFMLQDNELTYEKKQLEEFVSGLFHVLSNKYGPTGE